MSRGSVKYTFRNARICITLTLQGEDTAKKDKKTAYTALDDIFIIIPLIDTREDSRNNNNINKRVPFIGQRRHYHIEMLKGRYQIQFKSSWTDEALHQSCLNIRTVSGLCFVGAIANIAIASTAITMLAMTMNVNNVGTPLRGDLCLPCDALTSMKGLKSVDNNGTKQCCAGNGVQFSQMLEEIASKLRPDVSADWLPGYNGQENRMVVTDANVISSAPSTSRLSARHMDENVHDVQTSFDLSSVYAHKYLKSETNNSYKYKPTFAMGGYPLEVPIKSPQKEEHTETKRGVTVTETGMKIESAGLYYVYHGIQFTTFEYPMCSTFDNQTFYSLVTKYTASNGQSNVLLRAEHTCCFHVIADEQTLYTAGQFYFDTGDIIETKVTSFDVVNFDNGGTYIGIRMLNG